MCNSHGHSDKEAMPALVVRFRGSPFAHKIRMQACRRSINKAELLLNKKAFFSRDAIAGGSRKPTDLACWLMLTFIFGRCARPGARRAAAGAGGAGGAAAAGGGS